MAFIHLTHIPGIGVVVPKGCVRSVTCLALFPLWEPRLCSQPRPWLPLATTMGLPVLLFLLWFRSASDSLEFFHYCSCLKGPCIPSLVHFSFLSIYFQIESSILMSIAIDMLVIPQYISIPNLPFIFRSVFLSPVGYLLAMSR